MINAEKFYTSKKWRYYLKEDTKSKKKWVNEVVI